MSVTHSYTVRTFYKATTPDIIILALANNIFDHPILESCNVDLSYVWQPFANVSHNTQGPSLQVIVHANIIIFTPTDIQIRNSLPDILVTAPNVYVLMARLFSVDLTTHCRI